MNKAAHERQVFEEFAAVVGLVIVQDSVVSQPEPSPDIACRISGNPYLFELGRIADQTSVERIVESIKRFLRGDRRPIGGASSFHEPLVRIVRQKQSKTYRTGGASVDLLIYYDNEGPTFELPPPGDFKDWADRYLVPEVRATAGPFAGFWVFDRNEKQLLWRYP